MIFIFLASLVIATVTAFFYHRRKKGIKIKLKLVKG